MTESDRNKLVEDNIGLVYAVIKECFGVGRSTNAYDELVSAGMYGLLTASRAYDPEGGKFSTYAWHRIHGAMKDHIASDKMYMEKNMPRCGMNDIPDTSFDEGAAPFEQYDVNMITLGRDMPSRQRQAVDTKYRVYGEARDNREVGDAMDIRRQSVNKLMKKATIRMRSNAEGR